MELKRSFLTVLLTVLSLGYCWGQVPDSPIVFQGPQAVTSTFVDAPIGFNASSGGRTQWLKVEFHYSIAPKPPIPFLDSVEFRVWIEGRDLYAPEATTAEGIAVALTGTVTYINLAANKDGYGVFFVHPSVLARYGPKDGPDDFARKFNVHVEAYVNGSKVDVFDKNKEQDPNWFSALKVVSGMVDRQDQCPFINADSGKYPQMKLPSAP